MLVLAEFTCHDHSIIACSRHVYMGVVLCTNSVHGKPRIQRNASREVATPASSHNSQGIIDGGVNKAGISSAAPDRCCSGLHRLELLRQAQAKDSNSGH